MPESENLYNKIIRNDAAEVRTYPYTYTIAASGYTNKKAFRISGKTVDAGVINILTTVWEGSTDPYILPIDGQQMQIVSTHSADNFASGLGVKAVELEYLTPNFQTFKETINISGATAVNTVSTNIYRIQNFQVSSLGAGFSASGNIDLKHLSGSPTYSRIAISGGNTELQAIWTVPSGCTAYITKWNVGSQGSSPRLMYFYLLATCNDNAVYTSGIFYTKDILQIKANTAVTEFTSPIKIPAKTTIKVSAINDTSSTGQSAAASFEGWYEWD